MNGQEEKLVTAKTSRVAFKNNDFGAALKTKTKCLKGEYLDRPLIMGELNHMKIIW